ncbi:MAG: rhodanese-like domain-containing protein [Candidatus Paceibacterota bacterium]|jgi:phage shock protein E
MIIIDVRTKEEYEDGHVEGAINIPVQIIETADIAGAELSEPIAVYCRSGGRASVAKEILTKRGFTNITLYNEGRYQ